MAQAKRSTMAVAAAATAGVALTASTAFVQMTPQVNAEAGTQLRGAVSPSSPAAASSSSPSMAATGLVAAGGLAVAASSVRRTNRRHSATARQQAVQAVDTATREDIGDTLPDCPKTLWDGEDIDVNNIPEVEHTSPFIVDALEMKAELEACGSEAEYFAQKRIEIMAKLQMHGAIWFQNFESMKDASGFRTFFEKLQLNPCLDPIHTSGLRAMVEKKDAVYEAVNKPALAGHVVGLHNESTTVKTAVYGAFGCFMPATEGGGEFMLADGAKVVKNMDKDVLKRIYDNKVRISVSNLDLNFLGMLPDDMREGSMEWFKDKILEVVEPKFQMDLEMMYNADKSNPYRLSAVEGEEFPINRHPVTGQPVWFCNIHNHSRYLRDRRPCTVPEVGMTDVFYGDLSRIPPKDVDHINKVCEETLVEFKMKLGDVVLIDNYRVLHGRRTFKGERKHVVTWFDSCGNENKRQAEAGKPDNFMNEFINKTLVDTADFKKK